MEVPNQVKPFLLQKGFASSLRDLPFMTPFRRDVLQSELFAKPVEGKDIEGRGHYPTPRSRCSYEHPIDALKAGLLRKESGDYLGSSSPLLESASCRLTVRTLFL